MQTRLAYTAPRTCSWFLSSPNRFFTLSNNLTRGLCSSTRSQTADPNIHSGELEAGPDVHTASPHGIKNDGKSTKFAETDHIPGVDKPFEAPKSPIEPSPKLKSTGVNQRLEPNLQQKRKQGTKKAIEEVSCVGLDGSPWPKEEERMREEEKEDNIDYFKHHKASPLSELEFQDTRKPVTRVSDGTADSGVTSRDLIGWLPEQIDTAEDSLRRATQIWRQNAMRGDPDAPHSRVLRALRGQDF